MNKGTRKALWAALLCLGGVVTVAASGGSLWERLLWVSRRAHNLDVSRDVDPAFARDYAREQERAGRERQKW